MNTSVLIHNPLGSTTSYYIKKFFARGSEHWYKRPHIEARWLDSVQDDRSNTLFSSSRMTQEDNTNTIYLYNTARGKLRNLNIQYQNRVMVSFYSGNYNNTVPSGSKLLAIAYNGSTPSTVTEITGGWYNTGIYTASFTLTASSPPLTTVYDVWHSGGVEFFTGSFSPQLLPSLQTSPNFDYHTAITNLKPSYRSNEIARFRVYNRDRDWNPTIYTKAKNTPSNTIITSGAYEVYRTTDGLAVIPFGTGSTLHTMMSYDVSGNYFDLNMNLLEPDFSYGLRLAFYDDSKDSWDVLRNTFKFRVESDEAE